MKLSGLFLAAGAALASAAGADGQRFSLRFLTAEWEEVIDAWQIESWEAYRDVARLGRKTRLPEKVRTVLAIAVNGRDAKQEQLVLDAYRKSDQARQVAALRITDAIVEAQGGVAISGPGGANVFAARSTIRATTIFGQCWLQELLLGSEVLFDDVVTVARKQTGCVRFSYLAPGSVTPRTYECVPPDGATPAEQTKLAPVFTSRRFGHPGYAQVSRSGPAELAPGAANGSAIGDLSRLMHSQR